MTLLSRVNEHLNPFSKETQFAKDSNVRDAIGAAGLTAMAVAAIGYAYFGTSLLAAKMIGTAGACFTASYLTGKDGYTWAVAAIVVASLSLATVTAINDGRFAFIVHLDLGDIIRAIHAFTK